MVRRNLPMDIIGMEILTRLPAKSVGRFMCVCRQWQSLLSTQDFRRKNHHHITTVEPRSHQKLLLVDAAVAVGSFCTLDCGTTPTATELDLLSRSSHRLCTCTPFGIGSNNDDMHIVASLDGLVCVAMSKTKQLMLWNPLTGAYRMLSISHLDLHTFNRIEFDAFGLYSSSSSSNCNDDYKVLHLVRDQKGPRVYIYSRRLDSWIRKNLSFNYDWYLDCLTYQWSLSTFSGQTLYFTVVSTDHSCIAAFDVKSESFREIQFPPQVSGFRAFYNGNLVVINGCVHFCLAHQNILTQFYLPSVDIDVWRMVGDGDGDGDGWMKVAAYSSCNNNSIPFTLTPNCKVRHGKWDVTWRFNKAYTKHSVTKHLWSRYQLLRAIYIQTLISPNPP